MKLERSGKPFKGLFVQSIHQLHNSLENIKKWFYEKFRIVFLLHCPRRNNIQLNNNSNNDDNNNSDNKNNNNNSNNKNNNNNNNSDNNLVSKQTLRTKTSILISPN